MRRNKHAKGRSTSLAALLGLAAVAVSSIAPALAAGADPAGPDPGQVLALAVYSAVTGSDSLPDGQVSYNVTDPGVIAQILNGIEWSVPRDCGELETDNTTFMYLKYLDGTRKVYHLFLRNSHISLAGNRGTCFYVDPSSRTLIEDNTQ